MDAAHQAAFLGFRFGEGDTLMQRRHVLLGLAAIGTVLALCFAPPADDTVVGAVSRSASTPNAVATAAPRAMVAAATPPAREVLALRPRERDSRNEPGLFGIKSWDQPKTLPTPRPAAEPAPPTPQAPPAPLQLMGRYQEGSKTRLFGLFDGDSVVLEAGNSLGAEWRVETADANQVTLTHLPTGQKQSLPWGAAP